MQARILTYLIHANTASIRFKTWGRRSRIRSLVDTATSVVDVLNEKT